MVDALQIKKMIGARDAPMAVSSAASSTGGESFSGRKNAELSDEMKLR